MVIVEQADRGIAAIGKQIRKQQRIFAGQSRLICQIRIQLGRLRFYLGPAERAFSGIPGIRRRRGQNVSAGLLFFYAAEGNAAGASAKRMGADFNRPLHQLPGGINEFCRYGLACKCQLRMFVRRHGIDSQLRRPEK